MVYTNSKFLIISSIRIWFGVLCSKLNSYKTNLWTFSYIYNLINLQKWLTNSTKDPVFRWNSNLFLVSGHFQTWLTPNLPVVILLPMCGSIFRIGVTKYLYLLTISIFLPSARLYVYFLFAASLPFRIKPLPRVKFYENIKSLDHLHFPSITITKQSKL